MSLSKLKNWKSSVEIDYLALYIKTWFAFLSSVKYIHPNIVSNVGDGAVLRHYIDNIALPANFEQEIQRNIEKSYRVGKEIIKRDLPSSFFGKFYSIDNTYDFRLPERNHVRFRMRYRTQFQGQKNPNLFIEYKSVQRQFNTKFRTYFFSHNIFIRDIIDNDIYLSKDNVVDHIIQCLRDHGYGHIENMPGLQLTGKNQRKAYLDTVLTDISQQWRPLFLINELFQPLPVADFPDGYDTNANKLSVLRWFIRFSYDLRNILFHHIIDPFDEEWLKLFKTTYLALKEVVNHNLIQIEQMENND